MHIISKKRFVEAADNHPNQRTAIMDIYRVLKAAKFKSPEEMRNVFPTLDNFKYKDRWKVIDIGGNHLRLIAYIQFSQNRMYVKYILTHADYDKLSERGAKGEL